MDARTRLLLIGLVVLVALAPAGALAKVKKKTAAKIRPGYSALALDAAGVPHLAYQSPEFRPFHAARPEKKFVSEQVEDLSDAGWSPALGIDSTGRVHMAFHAERMLPSYAQALVYAYSGAAGWTIEEVKHPDESHVGGYATSLALDADDQVHLLYENLSGMLEYAQQEDVGWEFHDTGFAANDRTTSLALDADGYAHACYVNGTAASYATNASGDWAEELLDADGQLCSLVLDGDGRPQVAVLTPGTILLHRHDGVGFAEEEVLDLTSELPGFSFGPDGIALALDAADKPYLVATLFVSDPGSEGGAEIQLFLAHDGEEWRAALLGTKDEGFDPVLKFGPDGVLRGIWRTGGLDKAKLSYFEATFPDLAGSWSALTNSAGVVSGTLSVRNEGRDKSKSAPIALYLSSDPVLDGGDTLLPGKLKVGGTKPGAERIVAVEAAVAGDPSGQHLIAVIDPEKNLDDLDRSDNTVAALIP